MFESTPSLSLTASHHSPAHLSDPINPAFSATSHFCSLFTKELSLTPLFSASPSCSSSLFFTLEQISPFFTHSSQNTPGVGGHLSVLLKSYFKLPIAKWRASTHVPRPIPTASSFDFQLSTLNLRFSVPSVTAFTPTLSEWHPISAPSPYPLPHSCATLLPSKNSTRHAIRLPWH